MFFNLFLKKEVKIGFKIFQNFSSAWHSMHHLRDLSLAGNPINKVLNDSFQGLEKLESLDISKIPATLYQVILNLPNIHTFKD